MDRFEKTVALALADGSRTALDLNMEEVEKEGRTIYEVAAPYKGRTMSGMSDRGYFDALRKVRISLEQEGALLHCFGASEDVYPSPMRESMGPVLEAYCVRLGQQARSSDLVDIFDSDPTVRPATVEQQELFHQKWLAGLGT